MGLASQLLLRTFGNMQPKLAGGIEVGGHDLDRLSSQNLATLLSVVLTDRLTVGRLTAYDLIGLGRYPYTGWAAGLSREDHRIIQWAIRATRSEYLASRDVSELSDGERQRVMIARALASAAQGDAARRTNAFLDLPTRVEITGLLKRLARETGLAVLMSTHDLDLALRSADTLWLITQEREVKRGAPEDLILQGELQSTFSSSELDFDSGVGGFRPRIETIGGALLAADGLPAVWMSRALEREGYRVFRNGTPGEEIDVAIRATDSSLTPAWLLKKGGEGYRCSDIGSVVAQLRELVSGAPQD